MLVRLITSEAIEDHSHKSEKVKALEETILVQGHLLIGD